MLYVYIKKKKATVKYIIMTNFIKMIMPKPD